MPPKKIVKIKGSPVDADRFENLAKVFAPKENIEISPKDGWVLPNRVKFSQWIYDTFQYPKDNTTRMFPSQRFIKDYIQLDSPYRGILLLHGLGLGKTAASILAAENLIGHKDVVIMLPASLRTNYIEEIKRYGNKFFSKNQHWKFVHVDSLTDTINTVSKVYVSKEYIKKNKGLWIPTSFETSNWESLSNLEKQDVNKQLDHMIESKYKFINYNGITNKHIDAMIENAPGGNPFDGKVVIVDEVHNLISRTVGNGRLGKRIYELLFNATDVKLILLSGTPMINYPNESAYIINLIKGPQSTYTLTFKTENFDITRISKELDNHVYVDNYDIDTVKKQFTIQLSPYGYVFSKKKDFLLKRETTLTSVKRILDDIKTVLTCTISKEERHYILPFKREDFNEEFIDYTTGTINNPRMLARRMAGTISYFGTYFGDVYPKLLKTEIVNLKMSQHQFNVYEKNRFEERSKEERSKKKGAKKPDDGDIFKSTGQVYRAYSRANCNYVFPETIKRPYPGKMTMIYKEMDVVDGDVALEKDDEMAKDDANKYIKEIQQALGKLRENDSEFLKGSNLEMSSPKFAILLKKLTDCQGKALVYSQFRTVEGLGVLSMVLEANGWAEFKVKKTSSGVYELDIREEDMKKPKYFQYHGGTDETKLLMKIFNNDLGDIADSIKKEVAKNNFDGDIIKLIMITQSGAEGISLKHVREVHLLEPYWNEVRIEQVIGRAIRANSHVELPPAKRNVSVYRYLVSFTAKQIKDSKTIQNKDNSLTTDEYIHDIAQRKAKIIGDITELMKGSSVDCLVHNTKRDVAIKCIGFPKNMNPNELSYTLNLANEETDFEYKQKVKTKIVKLDTNLVFKKCSINGTPYAYETKTKTLYNYDMYKTGKLEKVGKLEYEPISGKMLLVK